MQTPGARKALRHLKNIGLLILLTFLALSSPSLADQVADPADWPMFQYNAQHTGYNDHSFVMPPFNLSWWARPFDTSRYLNHMAVADNRLMVTSGDNYWWYQNKTGIKCYNALTGKLAWQHTFDYEWMTFGPSAAYGRAYVQAEPGGFTRLHCYDLQSGTLLWTADEREQFALKLPPTISNGRVVTAAGTYKGLMCVDALTGAEYWYVSGSLYENYTPAVWNDTAYVFSDGALIAYKMIDGEWLWYVDVTRPSQAQAEGCRIMYMGIAPVIDTSTAIAYLMWHVSFTAVDLPTRTVRWQINGDFGCGINPCLYEGQVFAIDSGMLKCYDGDTGEELWRFDADRNLKYPPIASNGYVYVACDSAIYCLDVVTHEVAWQGSFGGKLAVTGSGLYVATDSGWVIAYEGSPVDVPDEDRQLPNWQLSQNYPNPFNPSTTISFALPRRASANLTIFNLLGERVTTLIDRDLPAGTHQARWDGRDASGRAVASGVYLYRLETDETVQTKKMLLVK